MRKPPPRRILFLLSYYRPHVSGLTIYVQRMAEALAERGHAVSVLTSRYDGSLERHERVAGVDVYRVPVWFWISKGAIMPGYLAALLPLLRQADVIVTNLPNTPVELLGPILGRLLIRRPVISTYHCDVHLAAGLFNSVVNRVVSGFNGMTIRFSDRVVAYTRDYATHSPVVSRFLRKCEEILPPVVLPLPASDDVEGFRARHAKDGETLVGFAARFATEKGVEHAVEALKMLRQDPRIGTVRLLFAGENENVLGEAVYRNRLLPHIRALGDRWRFLGVLEPGEMGVFFAACDLSILPSTNSTESFGLVQVESMLCGTPVIASDLPGVRVAIQETGMGRVIPIADSSALAEAIVEVAGNRSAFVKSREDIEKVFSLERTVKAYESLFERLIAEVKSGRN